MKRESEITLERENYLNELAKIHNTDADSLHTAFIKLSDIFGGLSQMADNKIESIMERMSWAYSHHIEKENYGWKDMMRDYGQIYRLMLILSRKDEMIHELKMKCEEIRDDLEKIMN